MNKFKSNFKKRNLFDFEDLGEDLYLKSAGQTASEKSHFKSSINEICYHIDKRERFKAIKKQVKATKMSQYLNFVKQHTQVVKE
jgi:hypothetical protein